MRKDFQIHIGFWAIAALSVLVLTIFGAHAFAYAISAAVFGLFYFTGFLSFAIAMIWTIATLVLMAFKKATCQALEVPAHLYIFVLGIVGTLFVSEHFVAPSVEQN